MKKILVLLGIVSTMFIGTQSFAACHYASPSSCPAAPCCKQIQPCCPACPVVSPCVKSCNPCGCASGYACPISSCNSCCNSCNSCNNCCREKCSWWKFWQNKNCCYRCDDCCGGCNRGCGCDSGCGCGCCD